jgi:hypothetical protein
LRTAYALTLVSAANWQAKTQREMDMFFLGDEWNLAERYTGEQTTLHMWPHLLLQGRRVVNKITWTQSCYASFTQT